jgi:two-component system nitrogen regulation sensor histidine kinase GlnL
LEYRRHNQRQSEGQSRDEAGSSDSPVFGRKIIGGAGAGYQRTTGGSATGDTHSAGGTARCEGQAADQIEPGIVLLQAINSGRGPDKNTQRKSTSSKSSSTAGGRRRRAEVTQKGPKQPGPQTSELSDSHKSELPAYRRQVESQASEVTDKLLNDLTTAVVILDAATNVTYMNTAAEDVLGLSLRRAANRPLAESVAGFVELSALAARALEQRQSFGYVVTIPTPQRDGAEIELTVRATPLEENDPGALLLELSDTTQRHHLDRENTLVAQHGVSRRMIQQLAHEIRNPLGGLRGAAQLLDKELNDAGLQEFTRVIIREADRLASLMDGLLGPGGPPKREQINVHEVLEHIATIAESEYPRLHIRRDYDPSLPIIVMDRDQMTQALLNILRNAAQATDGRGHIALRTRVLTNTLIYQTQHKLVACIEIQDDGPGVAEEVEDTLFYPLVTGRETGTGLGLPLAQDLVNRQGGLIEYDSVPGHTVFTVQLPITNTESAPA